MLLILWLPINKKENNYFVGYFYILYTYYMHIIFEAKVTL